MSELSSNTFCVNGHPQPAAATRFCIYCGVAMAAQAQAQMPPQQQQQYQAQPPPFQAQPKCQVCGGDGSGLPETTILCTQCRWLKPLVPGFAIPNEAFAWAADAKAMAALRAMTPLNAAAKAVSEKVGRRWIEVSFNGICLGEKQLPQIFGQAVRAARILGMSHMPDIYISGERPWEMLTFGTDKDSFIVIGSAIAGNFHGVDLLYLLAREMGHCKAGHALWKTVIRFFLGERGPQKGFMAGGIFNAILSPTSMITGAIEIPLLAWARQAEITADRAGLIAVASENVARRSLLTLSLKSSYMFRQVNMNAWLEQQQVDHGDMLRLSELTTTSTPYIGPRLKLLSQFAASTEFQQTVEWIKATLAQHAPPKPTEDATKAEPSAVEAPAAKEPAGSVIRFKCAACATPMRISRSVLADRSKLSVKCPNAKCGKLTVIKTKPKPAELKDSPVKPIKENESNDE